MRSSKTLAVAAATAACFVAGVSPAVASNNARPSSAPVVPLGVPFSGTWFGTPTYGSSSAHHWWRVGALVRTGDSIQVAIDNRASAPQRFCVVPPVDDFGADAGIASNKCNHLDQTIEVASMGRRTLRYAGPTGQPF